MSYDLRSRFKQKIDETYNERAGHLASGHAQTFDDYRERVGFLNGMKAAFDMLEEAARELNEQ